MLKTNGSLGPLLPVRGLFRLPTGKYTGRSQVNLTSDSPEKAVGKRGIYKDILKKPRSRTVVIDRHSFSEWEANCSRCGQI
jgi:hypothetical protein